ncbi:MAG: hypothetical protein PHR35_06605 [Kiritimatiellae bacterium]|nr:hypothetical protein [Kiritimatiellia bacterium]
MTESFPGKWCAPVLALAPLLSVGAPSAVVFEAETAAGCEAPMVIAAATNASASADFIAGASGESYLEIPEKAGNPPKLEAGMARFEVDLPAHGDYILWARVYWEGECSNSFSVQIDGGAPFCFGENATYRAWHWVKYPVSRLAVPIRLKQGRHTLLFRNREDGVRLDQVALSANKRFVPVGIEPANAAGNAP